jgi:hypothetical protein
LGNLSTPKSVQKLQTALHAKAKAEAGYRFYALYDKISREDILAHAYAQCRSNKGAPGVDGQDFADIDAYGVQRWLGELALALRQESYQPDPARREHRTSQEAPAGAGRQFDGRVTTERGGRSWSHSGRACKSPRTANASRPIKHTSPQDGLMGSAQRSQERKQRSRRIAGGGGCQKANGAQSARSRLESGGSLSRLRRIYCHRAMPNDWQ